ncbi:MAG: hypothetical protein J7M27_07190 [Candidatus Latescibacteria bacterium]|nr:hypothetical protein [Candidatus Latescibacterota bacterium]
MLTHYFHITPRDQLFMRDARPMEASDAGIGSNWPRPDQIYYALINAFHRTWPTLQPWEHDHHKHNEKNPESSCRFGGLKTTGPFPYDTASGQALFPCPLDVSAEMLDDDTIRLHQMPLLPSTGTNLPKPITHVFQSQKYGKQSPPYWITINDYQRYLAGDTLSPEIYELYDAERNIGIAIDPDTHATEESQLYQAEYLRLRHYASLAVAASCETFAHSRNGRDSTDVLEAFAEAENISWDRDEGVDIIMGGQQGVISIRRGDFSLPASMIGDGELLRWTLLTPAVYPAIDENAASGVTPHPGGWLPTWINPESGQVMLPRKIIDRKSGEDRASWRARINDSPKFTAKLIAARIGKSMVFSGWDLQTGPKPTMLAVPAGSVYVFHCQERDEMEDLSRALSWDGGTGTDILNRRSGMFGEKGYGLGVCSTI